MRITDRWSRPLLGLAVSAMFMGCAAHRTGAVGDSPEPRLREAERRAEALAADHDVLGRRLDKVTASLQAAEQTRDLAQAEVRERDAQIAALTLRHETELAELRDARAEVAGGVTSLERRLRSLRDEMRARDAEIERKKDLITDFSDNASELRDALTASQNRVRGLELDRARLADDLDSARLSGTVLAAVLGALVGLLGVAWAVQYRKMRRQAGRNPDLLHLDLPGAGGRSTA